MASIVGKSPTAVHAVGTARQGPVPISVGLPLETPTLPPKQVGKASGQENATLPPIASPLQWGLS